MRLTVVIPCRNEVGYIKECINAIYACDLPIDTNLNVMIVDGMSNDGTRELIKEIMANFEGLHLVNNQKQLTPFAFNLGIYTGGEADFVQIVGARHILSPNYLLNAIKHLNENPNTWCVGGRIINEYLDDTSEVIAKAMQTSFGMGMGNFRTLSKSGFTDTVTSPMYRYDVFNQVGFFDEELIRNQDDEFNFRITNQGKLIYYDHDISLKYYVRGSFTGLWRQFFQYGYWKVYVNKKHRTVTTSRQLIPPLFVLYLLTLPITLLFGWIITLIACVPLVLYTTLLVYFSVKSASSLLEVFKLMKAYLFVHFSYGLGYIKGMIEFVMLGKKPSDKQKRLSR